MQNDTIMKQEPAAYILPETLRQALLAYLIQRPFNEVAEGVRALTGLTPITSRSQPKNNT